MGNLFGGGGSDVQERNYWRQVEADNKAEARATELTAKQDTEKAQLKAEEDTTKEQLDTRRRRVASGAIGRRSLFSADETGFDRPTSTMLGSN